MSVTTKLVLFAAFVLVMLLMSVTGKRRKFRVLFLGDSLTEQGARQGGYITILRRYLEQEQLEDKVELAGAGVGGDKVTDLYERVGKDVLSRGADVVVIFIGINDVWHKITHNSGTDKHEFESVYSSLIQKLLDAKIRVILCTPTVIGEMLNGLNEFDEDLNIYSDIIRTLATKHELSVIDLRASFTDYLATNNAANIEQGILTADKIHLNQRGNELVAEAMWNELAEVIKQ